MHRHARWDARRVEYRREASQPVSVQWVFLLPFMIDVTVPDLGLGSMSFFGTLIVESESIGSGIERRHIRQG